jgi:hypothetical protein
MGNQISYSPEARERAVRLVFEQQKEHGWTRGQHTKRNFTYAKLGV